MEMQEEFRPVAGYEGKYEVSNFGRVKSLNHNRTGRVAFVGNLDTKGYARVCLARDGAKLAQKVHQLVAKHFLPAATNPDATTVNHIDGNKENNHVSNLEWATLGENMKHAHRTGLARTRGEYHGHAKVTEAIILEMRRLNHSMSYKEIAAKFGLRVGHVAVLVRGRESWLHLPVTERIDKSRKVSDADVLEIRELYMTHSAKQLGKVYGVAAKQIGYIIRGDSWPHLPVRDYTGRKPRIHSGKD